MKLFSHIIYLKLIIFPILQLLVRICSDWLKNYSFTLSYISSILTNLFIKCSSTKNLLYYIIPISPSFSFYHWFCCLRQYLVNANQTYYVKFKKKLIFICSPTSDNFQLEFLISHNYSTHFISNFFQCFWGTWVWWLLAFKLMTANWVTFA